MRKRHEERIGDLKTSDELVSPLPLVTIATTFRLKNRSLGILHPLLNCYFQPLRLNTLQHRLQQVHVYRQVPIELSLRRQITRRPRRGDRLSRTLRTPRAFTSRNNQL